MTKSRMIIIGLCALTVTIVTGAWLQQRALQQELASVTEALRATQARSDELAQTLEETREAATRLKRAHQEQLVASTKIAEASPAPRPVAAASPVPVTPTAEDQSDTPPETLTDKEKEQLAITKLDDYLTRTADADRRTRMRQGRRLLAELRELGPSATVALQQALLDAETSRDRSAAATLLGGLQDP
ncbi:MAG: hypothetical protein K0U93_13380, partial [Gammaproteobacteria bacterium]|nr:hypothetical protein [Gammaproteobacteria bacterium]